MDTPTKSQLEDMIAELKEQLEFCDDPEIRQELEKEISYRKDQIRNLTIKNKAL